MCSRCSTHRGQAIVTPTRWFVSARARLRTCRWLRYQVARGCSITCSPPSASSRFWSARQSARGVRPTRPLFTSSGCRSPSSASSRSRSAAGSIAWTGSSTGATRSRSWSCRRCSCISRWCSRNVRTCPGTRRCSRAGCRRCTSPAQCLARRAPWRCFAPESIPNTSSV